jgi:ubiquinone biosynthesis monooxygenase Coq6
VQHESYDVTIVGGGMVGSALALALATNPATRHLRVVLIEAAAPALAAPLSPSPSLRVSAVTPRSAAFFERIGAWAAMGAARVSKYTRMRVWHTMSRGAVEWNLREMMGESAERPAQPASPTASPLPPGWDNVDAASSVPPPSSALGYIVENDVIQNSLWRRMQAAMEAGRAVEEDSPLRCGLEVVSPIKIEQILPGSGGSDWPRVLLSNEQCFSTRLLIGADGPNSLVKRYAGGAVESFGWDYNQRAVVATLQTDRASAGQNDTAFQRFLPTGPIAYLPCHGGYANLVWSTTPAHAKMLCAQLTPQQFVQAVNTAFRAPAEEFQPGGRPALFDAVLPAPLAAVADVLFPRSPTSASASDSASSSPSLPPLVSGVVGPRLFFPLRFVHSSSYVSQRVALLGDAAHVIHPMAGQGVNLGFGDAEAMAALIRQNVLAGNDLGELDSLRPFEDERKGANAAMMAGIDALGRTFQPQDGPLALARAVGLDLFNAVPAIKNRAAEVAMGLKLHDK